MPWKALRIFLKNMRKLLYILIILISVFACKNQDSAIKRTDREFKNALHALKGSTRLDASIYMVIPRAGCSGCISTAEKYMMDYLEENKKQSKIKFILTDFDSQKVLLARFGSIARNQNVIIDPKNIFRANQSLKSIYPKIFLFKNEELVKVTEISPEKDGQAELNIFLKTDSGI